MEYKGFEVWKDENGNATRSWMKNWANFGKISLEEAREDLGNNFFIILQGLDLELKKVEEVIARTENDRGRKVLHADCVRLHAEICEIIKAWQLE